MEHDHSHMVTEQKNSLPSSWFVWAAVAVLAFYLFTEHRAHLFGALPWLLLLACPLMHVFMHGGHGGHGGHQGDDDRQPTAPKGGTP